MIPTMTVRMTLVLLLLCLGFVHFTFPSTRLRHFSFAEDKEKWGDSLTRCKQKNESAVTLYDDEDAKFTANFTYTETVWLGLRKVRNITWSNGRPFTFNKSSVDVTNGTQRCQAIERNTWKDYNCSRLEYFMCELFWGPNITNYTLVGIKKTWCQAREHCRNLHGDLVSISNDVQNNQVIEKGNNGSFWIGLMHDEWEWEDKGCSSFRKWTEEQPGNCTVHPTYKLAPEMQRFDCMSNANLFCSRGHVRIKVIKIESTWEQAFDYCKAKHTRLLWIENVEDQNAVVQWLNHTQADGPLWIGLRQSRVFGFWIWTSDRVVGYSNWKDNTQPELPLSNHCGVIKKSDNYTWSDENCLVPLHFLCEEEIYFMDD
ncbi:secretory phospholipase A2 receptor-like [Acanthopagrus latus]|uniref:secretory phospholipase A2 receptor-like n=1 Tax=Acanthopagrus latus TaxID=8177 RepID=UPI00187C057B|nr:secretory phospholipase A2 receptor-like [Acanthopagrus latus]